MTDEDVLKLLALMSMADNRKPPRKDDPEGAKLVIDFWLGMIGDLAYSDCAAAIQAHYQESREWIMPSDIRRRVKAAREERIRHSLIPAPPPELTEDPQAYREVLAANLQAAGDGLAEPAVDGPKMIGPPPGERTGGPPVSLRGAIRQLRRDLGDAREQRGIESPEAIAARQAAEQRGIDAKRNKAEEAS